MIRIPIPHIACAAFFAGILLAAHPAAARLQGEAEWGFRSYDLDLNSKKTSATTFQQQYALLYSKDGLLEYGRLGKYSYSLGYEWAHFMTDISAPEAKRSFSETSGHLLYSGDLELKPARFPFQLKAYSRDLNRTGFSDSGVYINTGDQIFTPGITGSFLSGTHIRNGVRMVLGLTRDAGVPGFKDYPKMVLDYRQAYDRDEKDISPIHTQNDVVSMSLTKGDAGFFYFRSEFQDKISHQKTVDSEYTVGTIGERGNRKWVDLSNWIRLSADATFAERTDGLTGEVTSEYDFNVFGSASRNKWDLVTLNNFNRVSSPSGQNSQSLTIPIYLKGIWDAETDWQLRLHAMDTSTAGTVVTAGSLTNMTNLLATLQVNALKRSMFTLTPSISVEKQERSEENTLILTAGVETASTRRFSERYALFGSYVVSVNTTDTADNQRHEFITNTLTGRGSYRVSEKLRLELEERLTLASGTTTTLNAYRYDVNTTNRNQDQNDIAFERQDITEGYYQTVTTLRASWLPLPRLRFGLELSEDLLHRKDSEPDSLSTLVGNVQYDLPSFAVGSSLRVARRTVGNYEANEVSGTGYARYRPDQKLLAEFNCNYNFNENNGGAKDTNVELIQIFRYSLQRPFGLSRKLLDLREELSYQRATANALSFQASDVHSSTKRLTLGADYYLSRNWITYAVIRYSLLEPDSEKELLGSGGITMSYRKIQANLEYSQGKRNSKIDNRVEKRFSASLKKQF